MAFFKLSDLCKLCPLVCKTFRAHVQQCRVTRPLVIDRPFTRMQLEAIRPVVSKVTSVDLSSKRCNVNTAIASVCKWPQVKSIYTSELDLSPANWVRLFRMPLTNLDLTECEWVDDDFLLLLAEKPLRMLTLDSCESITDAGLAHVAAMPLTRLSLFGCETITNAGLAHLSAMPLTSLDISGCNVTGAGIAHLAKLPLRTFEWQDNNMDVGHAAFAHLRAMPLTYLDISHCFTEEELTPTNPHALSYLSDLKLTTLAMTYCRTFSNDLLLYLKAMPLTCLHLGGNNLLSDLKHLSALPLRELSLCGCQGITDACLAQLPRSLTNLNISACPQLTAKGLLHLPRSLRRLDICSNSWVDREAIRNLIATLDMRRFFLCLLKSHPLGASALAELKASGCRIRLL
jgi:hypothetical protein